MYIQSHERFVASSDNHGDSYFSTNLLKKIIVSHGCAQLSAQFNLVSRFQQQKISFVLSKYVNSVHTTACTESFTNHALKLFYPSTQPRFILDETFRPSAHSVVH